MARKQLGAAPSGSTDTLIKSYLDGRITNASGKTLTVNNSLTLAGTDATTMIFPGTSDTVVTLAATQALTHKTLTDATNVFPTFNQSTTGNAATATALATPRTVQTNLASTSSASFDGSANVTPGVTGTLPVGNGGTGAATLTGLLVGNGTSAFTTVTAPSGTVVGTSDTQTLTNKTLTSPTISGYTETVNALGTVTSSKTIPAVSNGTMITATLTASTACTFTMPTATAGQSFGLLLKQAATTGGGTATFTGVKWNSSGTPTQTATAATMDIYMFVSDGTDWYGSYSQGYVP